MHLAVGDMELVNSGVYHLVDRDRLEYIDSIFENVLDYIKSKFLMKRVNVAGPHSSFLVMCVTWSSVGMVFKQCMFCPRRARFWGR